VSVLTRVFVVLLTVSSIALSMLVVAAFSQQQNWKASAEEWQQAALAAQARERTMAANAALEKHRAIDMHQRDLEAVSLCKAELDKSRASLAEMETALAEAKRQLSVEQTQVTSSQESTKLVQAALNREKEFGARLAKRNSELERANVDLTDRVKELTVNVEMARAQVRALQQQIASVDGMKSAAPGQVVVEAGMPTAAEPAVAPPVAPIRGEVRSVKGSLASISVGSADGVAHGMSFLIYRKGPKGSKPQYLGNLKITRVEANESAGEIEQMAGDVRSGDIVRDEASFAMRG
jgi:hypothetical protein